MINNRTRHANSGARTKILLVLFLLLPVAAGYTQPSFSFSSLPVEGGARNSGEIGYRWGHAFSSSLSGTLERTATASELSGFPDSLLYTERETIEVDVVPIRYRNGLAGIVDVTVGLGAGYNRQSVLERGNFQLGDPQVFRNEYEATRIGPLVTLDTGIEIAPFSLEYTTTLTPLYFLSLTQDILIRPLVEDDGASETRARGGLNWHQTLQVGLGRFVQLEGSLDIDQLELELLGLGVDGSEFVFEVQEQTVDTRTLRGFLNGKLPVGNDSQVLLGIGYEWEFVSFESGGGTEERDDGRWTYKFEFGW